MENKIKKAFEPVRTDEEMKTNVKQFLKQNMDSVKQKKRNHFQTNKIITIVAAACLILVFTSVFQMRIMDVQAAYVELTGPTEIGISLNKKNEVIKVVGLNESGQLIADEVDVKHMPYEKALELIMNCDAYKEHAEQEIDVDVNVECKDEACTEAIEESTEKVCQGQQLRKGQSHKAFTEQSEENRDEETEHTEQPGDETGNGKQYHHGQ